MEFAGIGYSEEQIQLLDVASEFCREKSPIAKVRALLESDQELIPNTVQECLRFVTPLAHMRRTASADTDLFGQDIKAGDKVVLEGLDRLRPDREVEVIQDAPKG